MHLYVTASRNTTSYTTKYIYTVIVFYVKKNSTVITRNTNCRNPETDGFFAAYSGCFCFSKRDNFVFTSSSVEGEAFMAMVGARCTGLVGETSMCLVMPALSSARPRIMSAWSKGK